MKSVNVPESSVPPHEVDAPSQSRPHPEWWGPPPYFSRSERYALRLTFARHDNIKAAEAANMILTAKGFPAAAWVTPTSVFDHLFECGHDDMSEEYEIIQMVCDPDFGNSVARS